MNDDVPALVIDASGIGPRVSSSARVVAYGVALPSSLGRDVDSGLQFNSPWSLRAGTFARAFQVPLTWSHHRPAISTGKTAATVKHSCANFYPFWAVNPAQVYIRNIIAWKTPATPHKETGGGIG